MLSPFSVLACAFAEWATPPSSAALSGSTAISRAISTQCNAPVHHPATSLPPRHLQLPTLVSTCMQQRYTDAPDVKTNWAMDGTIVAAGPQGWISTSCPCDVLSPLQIIRFSTSGHVGRFSGFISCGKAPRWPISNFPGDHRVIRLYQTRSD